MSTQHPQLPDGLTGDEFVRTVTMREAKTRLSQLVEAVEAGEEVIIARAGKPAVRLVKANISQRGVRIGLAKGLLRRVAPDFDAPLDLALATPDCRQTRR